MHKYPSVKVEEACALVPKFIATTHKKVKKRGKVISVSAMKARRGSRGEAPLILNPDTRQMSVVNFTDQPLYPKKKASQKSLERRPGEPHSPPVHGGEQKNLLTLVETNSKPPSW
jgi:hypothetical protein